jgi:hypothetical protein
MPISTTTAPHKHRPSARVGAAARSFSEALSFIAAS